MPPRATRATSLRRALAIQIVSPSWCRQMPSGAIGELDRCAIAGWSSAAETLRATRPATPPEVSTRHSRAGIVSAHGRGRTSTPRSSTSHSVSRIRSVSATTRVPPGSATIPLGKSICGPAPTTVPSGSIVTTAVEGGPGGAYIAALAWVRCTAW